MTLICDLLRVLTVQVLGMWYFSWDNILYKFKNHMKWHHVMASYTFCHCHTVYTIYHSELIIRMVLTDECAINLGLWSLTVKVLSMWLFVWGIFFPCLNLKIVRTTICSSPVIEHFVPELCEPLRPWQFKPLELILQWQMNSLAMGIFTSNMNFLW